MLIMETLIKKYFFALLVLQSTNVASLNCQLRQLLIFVIIMIMFIKSIAFTTSRFLEKNYVFIFFIVYVEMNLLSKYAKQWNKKQTVRALWTFFFFIFFIVIHLIWMWWSYFRTRLTSGLDVKKVKLYHGYRS